MRRVNSLNAFKTLMLPLQRGHNKVIGLVLWSCLLVEYHLHRSMSVKLNVPVSCNVVSAEEEELNKNSQCQGILFYVKLVCLNVSVHVRSVVLYEYLRHSMTSHSGC